MGFSTSGAVAVIFIGLLVAVGMVFPVLETAYDRQSTAISDRDDRTLDVRNTAIDANVSFSSPDDLTINVTNTGSTTLTINATDVLVDGIYQSKSTYSTAVDGDSSRSFVLPGEQLSISLTSDEPDRVKVVTEYGISHTITEV